DENSNIESTYSISRLAMNFSKRPTNDALNVAIVGMAHSDSVRSSQDIFSTTTSEQVKDIIMNNVRQELYRSSSQAPSESSQDDYTLHRIDFPDRSMKYGVSQNDIHARKSTILLAGPKFRCHTVEPEIQFMRDTVYPISSAVGFLSLMITLWKPISSFFSGFLVGFMIMTSVAYIITRIYMTGKADEMYFTGEIIFGRYDVDCDDSYIRYPVVVRLDNYHLTIQLPTKAKEEENKDKEIRFVGYREYFLKEANLMLVPEANMTRIKYWINEYPIIIQDLKILNKQLYSQAHLEKSNFDADDFFNNSQTVISLFLETGPEKENWFHKLSLVIRKGKDELERANRALMGAPSVNLPVISPTINMIAQSIPGTQIPVLGARAVEMQTNKVNLD
ncbi:unnamed protein product, partial [Rotaria magnacalcarata]